MKTILFVQNNWITFKMATHFLKKSYNVKHANNCQVGLEKIITHQPNLIVLELNLPDVGFQTLIEDYPKQIRKLTLVPLIALSPMPWKHLQEHHGFNGHINKPINPQELIRTIARFT